MRLGLENAVAAVLDRRLQARSERPVAVALSGGGDSLALLLIAATWARAHGRRLLVLSVDHGLNPEGAAWQATCAAHAARVGAGFQGLAWEGEKPATGLPAAARAARHRLLATAAREAGAAAILMGHTADDVAEAGLMRRAGGSTPSPREWAPSPAWPDGRGVFLLRPMLSARRDAIRAWLRARGETWIDDPSNEDQRFARSRARAALAKAPPPCDERAEATPGLGALALACSVDPAGVIRIPRSTLREAAPTGARAFLSAACVCAGGGARPPRGERTARLLDAILAEGSMVATLAGASVRAEADEVRICREAGDLARRKSPSLSLEPGVSLVWDGRFAFTAVAPGLAVRPLAGVGRNASPEQRTSLRVVDARARQALPVVMRAERIAGFPVLQPVDGLQMRGLVGERLLAACGVVEREPA